MSTMLPIPGFGRREKENIFFFIIQNNEFRKYLLSTLHAIQSARDIRVKKVDNVPQFLVLIFKWERWRINRYYKYVCIR